MSELSEFHVNDLWSEILSRVKRISVHPPHPENKRPDALCVWFEFKEQANTVLYAQDALDDPFTVDEMFEQLASEQVCRDCAEHDV